MEQLKEKKLNLFDVLFGKNEYKNYDDSDTTYVESPYIEGLKKETEGSIKKEENKSSKNGGFSEGLSKFDKTLAKMQKTQGIRKPEQDKDKEDDEIVK